MNTWLVKQEPSAYPFSRFLAEKRVVWDGVRNYQARNFLRQMKKGDLVLYYHSVDERAVVGTAKVSRTAFPDPTASKNEDWTSVESHAATSTNVSSAPSTPPSPWTNSRPILAFAISSFFASPVSPSCRFPHRYLRRF